jgi:predicted outer membrane repeat protein
MLLSGGVYGGGIGVTVGEGEILTIAGDPDAASWPELDGMSAGRVLSAEGAGTLVLRRLSLVGGTGELGGCLRVRTDAVRLEDTSWSACAARQDGGAVYSESARIEILRSVFEDNSAERSGGAVAANGPASSAAIVVGDSDFVRNGAARGGALAILVPTVESAVTASRFRENVAGRVGSAIWGYLGGRIAGNRFERNVGGRDGGAVAGEAGWYLSEITQNVFVENVTGNVDVGGTSCCDGAAAVDLSPAYVTIRNNVFVRNRSEPDASYGTAGVGAVRLVSGASRLLNNTFVDNAAPGGVAHVRAANADLRGNVFTGTAVPVATNDNVAGGWAITDYNLVWNATAPFFGGSAPIGTENVEADPLFVDESTGDFRPAPGSPCTDAGPPDSDLRDPDGTRNDIGAFGGPEGEWTSPTPPADPAAVGRAGWV